MGKDSRWIVLRPVVQFAAIGLAAVVIVGLATLTASRRIGQREAITDARTTTLIRAQTIVEPAVTDGLMAGDSAAVAAVADVVGHRVVDVSLIRVKIWTAAGKIVYSNEASLIGSSYSLEEDDLNARCARTHSRPRSVT